MFARHPEIAKRWAAVTDQSKLPTKVDQKDSRQTWKPGVVKLPKRTNATDFKHLSPGPKARHTYSTPAKEQDSMAEGPITFVPNSRGHHLDQFKRRKK